MAGATIVISPIANQTANTPFTVTGTYTPSQSSWTDQLAYQDNGGAVIPIAAPVVTLGTSTWSFTNPGLAPGNHTVTVRDSLTGTTVVSNTFVVTGAQTITVGALPAVSTGQSFTFTGTLTGYTTPPALTYSLNGGAATQLSGVTTTGWSTSIVAPATTGAYSIIVSSGSVSSPPATLTVSPPTPTIAFSVPTGLQPSQAFTFTGTLTNYTTVPSLTYFFDGSTTHSPLGGVTLTGWSTSINVPATTGNHTLTVSDGTVNTTVQFAIVATAKTIAPLAPSSPVATVAFTFSGVLTGYASAPTLTYTVNGGASSSLSGVSTTGWAASIVVNTSGSTTIVVTDAANAVSGSVTFTVAAQTTTVRDFRYLPGQDNSFWVQPFASSANWISSGASVTLLRNGSNAAPKAVLTYPTTSVTTPSYFVGAASDPQWTVTDGAITFPARIPAGSVFTSYSIGGADLANPYRVWCASNYTVNTTTNTITAQYVAVDDGSGIMFCEAVTGQIGYDDTAGLITNYDLTQLNASSSYVIQHMLSFSLDPSQVTTSIVWPLDVANSGATGSTSALPQGITIGIPAATARPAGMTRGQAALFDQAQQFGGFMYNIAATGSGCLSYTVASPLNSANQALVTDMANNMSWLAQYLCILNYASGTAGAQYSLATIKGATATSVPAFPVTANLDLTPTGGANIPPATVGAWYSTGNLNVVQPTGSFGSTVVTKTITPVIPSSVVAGTAFTFTGNLVGYTTIPALTYSLDGGTATAVTGVTTTTWSMSITVATSGSHTIKVTDATNAVSGTATFTVSATAGTGQFRVVSGKFVDPHGHAYQPIGLAVGGSGLEAYFQSNRAAQWANANFVRYGPAPWAVSSVSDAFIQAMTALRIVVVVGSVDYPSGGAGTNLTGAALTAECNTYAALATTYKSNPYVWFGTPNEPPNTTGASGTCTPGTCTAEHVAIYNAIRATGSTAMIEFEQIGGGAPPGFNPYSNVSANGTMGANNQYGLYPSSAYASMTNVFWGPHQYNWLTGYSTSVATNQAMTGTLAGLCQQITTGDGTAPVAIMESGVSTTGTTPDVGGTQSVAGVQAGILAGGYGYIAWAFGPYAVLNSLNNSDYSLTSYGTEASGFINANAVPIPAS